MNIYKDISTFQNSNTSNRYQVKKFNSTDAMHKFLNKQYDNRWKVLELEKPLKSGTYFQQYDTRNGTNWINVKELYN